ncbi:hypothetical protein R5R35_008969 [Gryllus longicercus]|uniref:RNase NYN domain-containing protein n=1 Tax=Gryllus longicercus TaxID=2509291 RepID=A0AAN9Z6J3_9ORTH
MAPRKKRKSIGQSSSVKRVTSGVQKQNKKKNDKKPKRSKNDSIQEITMNETFVPLSGDENISEKNKEMKPPEDVDVIGDGNILGADFIPFSAKPLQNNVPKINDEVVANQTIEICEVPETIVVDDDNDEESICVDDSIASSDSESDSVNDSIQIVAETQKSSCGILLDIVGQSSMKTKASLSIPKKRKIDDSIEILETNSVCDRPGKKVKIHKSQENSSASLSIISNSDDEAPRCLDEDDEIVIVETIDNNSRDSVKVMNDFIPVKMSSALEREKTRRKKNFVKRSRNRWNLGQDDRSTGAPHSVVIQDTVGIVPSSAHYKSPLSNNANQETNTVDTYHNVYGNNVYNPNSVQKTGLRPVIIDGSNVAFGHGGKSFSTRGIEICVNYFVKRGHWVVAFVPLFRRSEVSDADRKILDELKKNNQLAFTPSRFLHGRRVASYDDRFIVQCAAELGGIVVSTDNYRDLICENEAWRETIEKRLLMFTWVGDLLMFPDDPNGRGGPRLEEFLRFPR